jgi:hypothetical protein
MNIHSAKAKGKRLQNSLREALLMAFPTLEPDDIKSAMSSEIGEDLKLSPAAKRLIPYSFECKNTEKLAVWAALEQAQENANGRQPVVVFSRNRSVPYVIVSLDAFINLISRYENKKPETAV